MSESIFKGVSYARIMLRWGLAFTFFYAAISSLRNPQEWIGYFPSFLINAIPNHLLVVGFSAYELVLAVWLFWGKKLKWSSLLAAISILGIVVFNFDLMDAMFRDVGLGLAALALFDLARNDGGNGSTE